jgi:hypothetical protein
MWHLPKLPATFQRSHVSKNIYIDYRCEGRLKLNSAENIEVVDALTKKIWKFQPPCRDEIQIHVLFPSLSMLLDALQYSQSISHGNNKGLQVENALVCLEILWIPTRVVVLDLESTFLRLGPLLAKSFESKSKSTTWSGQSSNPLVLSSRGADWQTKKLGKRMAWNMCALRVMLVNSVLLILKHKFQFLTLKRQMTISAFGSSESNNQTKGTTCTCTFKHITF